MKFNISKEWFLSRVNTEEGLEIGAGFLNRADKPALRALPAAESNINTISQHVSFGRFVSLMRRKKGWTIPQLAEAADVDPAELLVIEHTPHCEPELSTVVGLAKTFDVPVSALVKMAGLAEDRSTRLQEEGVAICRYLRTKGAANEK